MFNRIASLWKRADHTDRRVARNVSAVRFVRKMGGRSRSMLIEASDGLRYVLKDCTADSDMASRLGEALGSEIATHIGLPIPNWQPVFISESFIRGCSEIWNEGRDGVNRPPVPGYYFGSECLSSDSGNQLYDYLPATWLTKINNRTDFAGMLLLDMWASNSTCRQALFIQGHNRAEIRAIFIGHGKMFSASRQEMPQPMAGRYSDSRIYRGGWTEEAFSYWQDLILSVKESSLRELVSKVPIAWVAPCDINRIISDLLLRQILIRDMKFTSANPCDLPWKYPCQDSPCHSKEMPGGYIYSPALGAP